MQLAGAAQLVLHGLPQVSEPCDRKCGRKSVTKRNQHNSIPNLAFSCHDLNLCTQPSHREEDGRGVGGGREVWICQDCQQGYDMAAIEFTLVEQVLKRSAQWQAQDLRCAKTGKLVTTSLKKESSVSANLRCDLDWGGMRRDLKTLGRIADEFELEWLEETVQTLKC